MQYVEVTVNLDEFTNNPLFTQECLDESDAYMEAFAEWWDKHDYHVIQHETPIINEIDGYGGTPDMIATDSKGITYVMDIKTGFVDEYSCCLQLAAYAKAWEDQYPPIKLNGIIIGFEDIIGDKRVKTYEFDHETLQRYYIDFLSIKSIYRSKQQFEKERRNDNYTKHRKPDSNRKGK